MNVQLYAGKKNFDVQKAERFFKERRIPVQVMDMKKHRLGQRELETFARALGTQNLLDKSDAKIKEHPACYYNRDVLILSAILEAPWLLRSPIVRSGSRVTAGYCPDIWEAWLAEEKQKAPDA